MCERSHNPRYPGVVSGFLNASHLPTAAEITRRSVGIEAVFLSAAGYSLRRERDVDELTMAPRPLLSNLVVDPSYRRRGLARRLCLGAEAAARGWGYDEVMLKVDTTNTKVAAMYASINRDITREEVRDGDLSIACMHVCSGRAPTTTNQRTITRPH